MHLLRRENVKWTLEKLSSGIHSFKVLISPHFLETVRRISVLPNMFADYDVSSELVSFMGTFLEERSLLICTQKRHPRFVYTF